MPSRAYQRILRKYRSEKVRISRSGMNEIRAILRTAAEETTSEIERLSSRYGQDNVRIEQLRDLQRRIDQALDEMNNSYRATVATTRDRLGDSAVDRTSDLVAEVTGTPPPRDILVRAKLGAFEKLATRTRFADGLLLSERIWRVTDDAKRKMGAILSRDVLLGYHPTKIARDLRGFVVGEGRGNLRYVTERLARTEHTAAFAETSRATLRAMNRDREIGVKFGMRFNISPGHPETDICDEYTTKGDIEPDIYSVGAYPNVPLHPHCECYDTPVPLLNGKPL